MRRLPLRFSPGPPFWMSAAYFAYYAAIACWSPYIVLYYAALGLSGTQIGVLNAVMPLGMVFLAPLWGSLADTYNAHRLILRVALLATATVGLFLTAASGFGQVALLIVLFTLVGTTAAPLLDAYGVTIGAGTKTGFGRLRVWGSVGYTVVVWLVGAAMGRGVSPLFLFAYAAALTLTFAATLGLPPRQGAHRPQRRGAGLWRRRDIRLLLLVTFLLFTSTTPMFTLFGLYVEAQGGTSALIGAASAVAAISELPVFFWGGRLVGRFGSRRLYGVALGVFAVRTALYTVVPSAPWILAVQGLHGLSFGFYLIAAMALLHERVGSEKLATAQGLLASAMACGQIVGALLSGAVLERFGIFTVYGVSAVVMVLALAVFIGGGRRLGEVERLERAERLGET